MAVEPSGHRRAAGTAARSRRGSWTCRRRRREGRQLEDQRREV